ncbi:hypothetical protein N5Z71_003358 [Salmonella enterica]|nr:hypothetical protein [Salmonella enterica]EJU8850566.1 hypothetical protein [Salmonella enterica]EKR1690962.1 hypothetical protein [Salmonella enterica subsp. diarizonae serovar 6,7,14:k:z50]EKR1872368.1 hypothetical protein [Salmonella enterica subsp. diarizonae serovar 11:k:z53]HDC2267705.1 hypothetical protein [Salmonella enterica]
MKAGSDVLLHLLTPQGVDADAAAIDYVTGYMRVVNDSPACDTREKIHHE